MIKKNLVLINESYNFFKKKRYDDAIALLEKVESSGAKDPYPYFLLSISYLLTNRFDKSNIILNKIRMIDPDYLPFIHLESFFFLKSAPDLKSVLSKYIDGLQKFSNDKYLKKIIKKLRKVRDFQEFQRGALLNDFVFFPKPPREYLFLLNLKQYTRSSNIKGVVIVLASIVIIIALSITLYLFVIVKNDIVIEKQPFDVVSLDVIRYDLIDKIKKKKTPVFYYSNNEVRRDFNNSKLYIKKGKYNDAMILVNKILNSNLNFRVRERVDFLRRFIIDIEGRKYCNISFQTIAKTPYLYNGVCIKWKGKISNLKRKDNKLIFNLLVDYIRDDVFSGIVDVYADKDVKNIENGDIAEVEGIFINTFGSDKRIYLVAKNISRIQNDVKKKK